MQYSIIPITENYHGQTVITGYSLIIDHPLWSKPERHRVATKRQAVNALLYRTQMYRTPNIPN